MGKKRQQRNSKDHTKMRLQLFYLDELVQIASESLWQLDGPSDSEFFNN